MQNVPRTDQTRHDHVRQPSRLGTAQLPVYTRPIPQLKLGRPGRYDPPFQNRPNSSPPCYWPDGTRLQTRLLALIVRAGSPVFIVNSRCATLDGTNGHHRPGGLDQSRPKNSWCCHRQEKFLPGLTRPNKHLILASPDGSWCDAFPRGLCGEATRHKLHHKKSALLYRRRAAATNDIILTTTISRDMEKENPHL